MGLKRSKKAEKEVGEKLNKLLAGELQDEPLKEQKKSKPKKEKKTVENVEEIEEPLVEGVDYELVKPSWQYMKYLGEPNLFNLITEIEFDKKIVGEVPARKVIFLCSCGRLVINSQVASYNLLVNDDAGIGKDYVTKNVLKILPKEVYIHRTRISPAVFTYWHNPKFEPQWTWDGKIFYPEDISENVLNSDVFKVMCSDGSNATMVIKQRAIDIKINGKPVMITTTATATPSPELTRRFVILNLDSSEDQTKLIMERHSKYKAQGIVPDYNLMITESLQYLKRYKVKVPFAEFIHTYFPSNNIIMRTHYPRFLDFICASTCLYQFQRKKDGEYLIAEPQDYDIARECFLKICSNKYMIPLTINQKKIMACFEKDKHLSGHAGNLHGSVMNFLSLPALQTNLGLLTKYGMLETKNAMMGYKEVEVYSLSQNYNPNENLYIPTFDEIVTMKESSIGSGGVENDSSSKDIKDTKDT